MAVVLPGLMNRTYVQRFSWKTRDPSDIKMGTSAICYSNGSLTEVGQFYSNFNGSCTVENGFICI